MNIMQNFYSDKARLFFMNFKLPPTTTLSSTTLSTALAFSPSRSYLPPF